MIKPRILAVSFLLILFTLTSNGAKSSICFTFDDLPVDTHSDKSVSFQRSVISGLVHTCKQYHIPAIGFVNEGKMYRKDKRVDSAQIVLLQTWLKAKLELGNHTFSHPDYNKTSCVNFGEDILNGEKITRPLMKKHHKKLQYFRHPFLSIGDSQAKYDSLEQFLAANKYIVAPITIENDDWIFDDAYDSASVKKDSVLMRQIGQSYIEFTEKQIKYNEMLSVKVFRRNISQILLLHSNAINRDYLPEIAQMCKRNNYKFVSIERSLRDKAYLSKITNFGDWGASWLIRWAMSMDIKGNLYAGLPLTPAYVLKLAGMPLDYK
ncbi:MAG: polysaccharide deacetylase family protein [Bacteroidota bacterium]|nr:polysaccharide deacetylase family protein [Bacteroidota bacterium]